MALSLLIFVNASKKGNAVEASYVKVILGCVVGIPNFFSRICLCHVTIS